jgi:ent-kaurene oxidase
MVEKFSSISTRKLAKAVSILSRDKKMVAGSDDSDFHKNGKRHIVMSLLGSSALVWLTTIPEPYSFK